MNFRPLCVIPVFNHAGTIETVVRGCRAVLPDLLVVDDGSTDADLAAVLAGTGATVLRHPVNLGKGAALQTALDWAQANGFTHLAALDADGQHDPADLPALLNAARAQPDAIVMGVRGMIGPNVPGASRFGRAFSNFWVLLETGRVCRDTQSGFRVYPVGWMHRLACRTRHYDFEIESLVRAAWAGIPYAEAPVSVRYAPAEERISHFRKWLDNARLSLLHARLVGRRLVPWPNRRLIPRPPGPSWRVLLRPRVFVAQLLHENATPAGLAASAAVSSYLAVLPIPFGHTVAILYVATRFRLNRVMALSIQNLYAPPFVPWVCMSVGSLILRGHLLQGLPRTPAGFAGLLAEWAVGAAVLAPFYAAVAWVGVFRIARHVQRKRARAEKAGTAGRPAAPPPRRRGNALGFWCFRMATRFTGLRGAYGMLYLACPYYLLFDRAAVAGAMAYLKRRFPGRARPRLFGDAFRLFLAQGRSLIDRHAHAAGGVEMAFEAAGEATFRTLLRDAQSGLVLLMAHTGGWQLAMPLLGAACAGRPVSLLMRPEDNPAVRRHIRGAEQAFHVIAPDDFPGCVVEMVLRLQRGELVSIMGDRHYGGQTVEVAFLGDHAVFPAGAYGVAAAAGCPVVALFAAKTGTRAYRLETVNLGVPDRRDWRRTAQRFADALADFTRRHPYQCFLFFDVWKRT